MANGKYRDGRREARWRRIVLEHERSGLGVREFCRRGKLTETAFYFWRHELQRRQAEHLSGVALAKPEEQRRPDPAVVPAFVPVRVAEHAGEPGVGRIEIELSGGQRIYVTAPVDRQALADVLAVLRFDDLTAPSRAEGEGRPC